MNDLRLSAFAPRRRFLYAATFDGYAIYVDAANSTVESDTGVDTGTGNTSITTTVYATTEFSIQNSTVECNAGHGILVNFADASTCSITKSTVTGGNTGILFYGGNSTLTVDGCTVTGQDTYNGDGIYVGGYNTSLTLKGASTVVGGYHGISAKDTLVSVDGGSTVTGGLRGIYFVDSYASANPNQEEIAPPDGGIIVKNGTVTVTPSDTYANQYAICYQFMNAGTLAHHVTIDRLKFSADTITIPPWSEVVRSSGAKYYRYDSSEVFNSDGNAESAITSGTDITVSGDYALLIDLMPN